MAAAKGVEARPTAGLRGASWNPELLPAGMNSSVHAVPTSDGAQIVGYLHARGGERAVVVIMHPRELLATHYLVPYIVQAGFACWVQGTRTVGNDLRLEHEIALLDVAAGLGQLRALGFEKIVLLGNSGGAGLFAFYTQQSLLEPAKRIARSPGGRPSGLDHAAMPTADGLVFVAPHPGRESCCRIASTRPSSTSPTRCRWIRPWIPSASQTASGRDRERRYAREFAIGTATLNATR